MSYTVTGMGVVPLSSMKPDLQTAARTASKMIDQGVMDVRVYDSNGTEVIPEDWEAAWWEWANSRRPEEA